MTRSRQAAAGGARPEEAVPSEPCRQLPIWAQRLLGLFGFGGMAVACVLLGVVDLVRCAEALARGAPTASFQPGAAMTVTLFVAFVMFAAMCTLPDPEIRLRPSGRSPGPATPRTAVTSAALRSTTRPAPRGGTGPGRATRASHGGVATTGTSTSQMRTDLSPRS